MEVRIDAGIAGRSRSGSHNTLGIIQLRRATDGTMLRRPCILLRIRLREGCFRTATLPDSGMSQPGLEQPRNRGSGLTHARVGEAVPRAFRATGEDVNRSATEPASPLAGSAHFLPTAKPAYATVIPVVWVASNAKNSDSNAPVAGLKIRTCGPPPGPAPVISLLSVVVARRTPPINAGS